MHLPQDTDQERLGRFLGELGILSPKPSSDLAKKSFLEILGKVPEQGGVTVAAHVTNNSGLFTVLSGQSRIKAWQSDDLRAIQIPGQVGDLPQDVRVIVENRNADYRRTHAAEERLAIAVVNARDIVKPEDLEDRSATCWIKMSEVSIEGLRQAFLRSRLPHSTQSQGRQARTGGTCRVRRVSLGRRLRRRCCGSLQPQPQRPRWRAWYR